jgi:HlyD family secretion protein
MKHMLIAATLLTGLFACSSKVETIQPIREDITEAVYASGIVKSKNQYQVYTTVTGTIGEVLVKEGMLITKGTPLFQLSKETPVLNRKNAALSASFADLKANQSKLREASIAVDLAKAKFKNDSLLLVRQQQLWEQQIGSKVELEQRELAYQNAKTAYQSAVLKLADLQRQLQFNEQQSRNNLALSEKTEQDFTIKSEISGRVYDLLKEKGELVTPQTPVAVIGDANQFEIELQIDEYDISRISQNQRVLITLDSYQNQVFEAVITLIHPILNERTKTCKAIAVFTKAPERLYPNLSVEANIIVRSKKQVLTIPRSALHADQTVSLKDGTTKKVEIGLKDYQKVEILSGLNESDELIVSTK